MQATVWEFDTTTRSGRVLLDTGVALPFDGSALADSGLRLLRVGQRVKVETGPGDGTGPGPHPGSVRRLQILTLPWVSGTLPQ